MKLELANLDRVLILPPDGALRKKIGNADLDQLLSPFVVETAQRTIDKSSSQFLDESLSESEKLGHSAKLLKSVSGNLEEIFGEIIKESFAIKAKAGFSGYDLVAKIARSLQLFCEKLQGKEISPRNLQIVEWHVGSLRQLLASKAKGSGGVGGQAILSELEDILARLEDM